MLTKDEYLQFKEKVEKAGYKSEPNYARLKKCEFAYYKAFYNEDKELLYQIFYKFWNFEKYGMGNYGIDIEIMPNNLDIGIRDLNLDYTDDHQKSIPTVERIAKEYYEFITKTDSYV